MKYSYWIAGGVLLAVVLIIVFVPGVAEGIERRLLGELCKITNGHGIISCLSRRKCLW